jgi:hypothetical protein
MSTTFDVLPCKDYIPTFSEIIELADSHINTFLRSIGINEKIDLMVNIHKNDEGYVNNQVLSERAQWAEDSYAWFYINGVPGGTDAHFWSFDESEREIWKEEIQTNSNAGKYADEINRSLRVGNRWNFRRSAGQPGIIVLSYGLIAAAIAQLTDGLIYTDDGAWDYSLFPAKVDDFLNWYFRPEIATHTESKEWAEVCIDSIRKELEERVL